MKANDIHNKLKNDKFYKLARETRNVIDMRITLKMHGMPHSIEQAAVMVNFNFDGVGA
jgi:hypothetical protein